MWPPSPDLMHWLSEAFPRGLSGRDVRLIERQLGRLEGEEVFLRLGPLIGLILTRATNRVEIFSRIAENVPSAEGDWEEVKAFLLASPSDRRGR